ncbi:arrestin domain-containing protein 3-like isoform X1 [Acanthochromis polyacanthus]|uniref:arrestin domain-containing protein 3-like isoform X1 n=1 Tax=Acanthochromis polyacanthus TaxID=80966 RepID=UPI0022341AC9|nr:arrestin domain-containing protein 3-like isoform X1 [Acanthochromis polyacanthus]
MFGSGIKNLSVSVDRLNEKNTFSSGDQVTGRISFEITKQTKITSITVALAGVAHVHWSTGGGGGRRRRTTRKHHSAKMEYFNYKGVILQENGAVRGTTKLSPGTHVYPFTCQLPQGDFPSTFHGTSGRILYTLKVDIYRPWHLSKNFETELNFVHHINTNLPDLWAPLSGTNSMTLCCLCCASGPLTMTATVEKKAFIPGETVKINCNISNGSFTTATPKARLEQKQTFYTQRRERHIQAVKRFKSVSGEPVVAHTSVVQTEIRLTLPSSAYLTISNCSILEVEYKIEVSLSVRTFPDVTVLVPIILYDGSAHTNSLPLS